MGKPLLTDEQWLKLTWGGIAASVIVTVWAFSTFEKAGASEKVREAVEKRMDRVEKKVDAMLLNEGLGGEINRINEESYGP